MLYYALFAIAAVVLVVVLLSKKGSKKKGNEKAALEAMEDLREHMLDYIQESPSIRVERNGTTLAFREAYKKPDGSFSFISEIEEDVCYAMICGKIDVFAGIMFFDDNITCSNLEREIDLFYKQLSSNERMNSIGVRIDEGCVLVGRYIKLESEKEVLDACVSQNVAGTACESLAEFVTRRSLEVVDQLVHFGPFWDFAERIT